MKNAQKYKGHRRALAVIAMIIVVAAIVVLWPLASPAYSRAEISGLVDKLNYSAAINTPHRSLGKDIRSQNLALFEKVEQGHVLDEKESASYRVLYQSILRDKQRYLALFDRNLIIVDNHGMDELNNVGSSGIAGRHDHHDYSARSNLESLKASLNRVETAAGPAAFWVKTVNTASAYKDLTDIILHMATAPQTKSTPYHSNNGKTEVDRHFDDVMSNYKSMQFEPVNSPGYILSLHRALESYDRLVFHVQSRLDSNLSIWERAVAGRWLSWRSLGPSLGDKQSGPFARTPPPQN